MLMQRNFVHLDFLNTQTVIHTIIFACHYLNVEFHGLKRMGTLFILGFLLMRLRCLNTDINTVMSDMGIVAAAIRAIRIGSYRGVAQ